MSPDAPRLQYTLNGGLHIAYQVVGDGPIDLVLVGDWWIPLDLRWDDPMLASALRRLASFTRLITFDKRGIGCSDRVPPEESSAAETWMDDMRCVLDAVGSERVAAFGVTDGGAVAMMFAATYPDRTAALVLADTAPRLMQAPDYPWGMPWRAVEPLMTGVVEDWIRGTTFAKAAPHLAADPHRRDWLLKGRRLQASPGTAKVIYTALTSMDVRHVLPAIQAPTLVLQRRDNYITRAGHGRYLADHIPGAKYVELPGRDISWWMDDADAAVDEIEEFLTGVRPAPESNRILATVLFTDIVGSTEQAAKLGDASWRQLLDRHDRLIRQQLDRFRGREIKVVGDEFVATFDGPARAIRCAFAIVDSVSTLGLDVRAGLHTGEIELRGDDIAGVAVHIGARVAALAGPGEVLVSGAVPPLVAGSGLDFNERGRRELKGVPGQWSIFAAIR